MTVTEAYQILELSPGAEMGEIKKKYRHLMHRMHPDVYFSSGEQPSHPAQELNLAYAVLKKELAGKTHFAACPERNASASVRERRASARKKHWDAPVNEHAYREREIFCQAEVRQGETAGIFRIARGKYLWKTEEDFSLFLRSVFLCGKEILDEIDDSLGRTDRPPFRQEIHGQLTYLLAQQFIDGTALLAEIAREAGPEEAAEAENGLKSSGRIFYLPVMLETEKGETVLKEKESLYPSRLHRHRLYLKNTWGKELGYLSFPDDRLYYIVVPLFEQRRVRVKICAAGRTGTEKKKGRGYCRLHLWIKLDHENPVSAPENLNLQIERLLAEYR